LSRPQLMTRRTLEYGNCGILTCRPITTLDVALSITGPLDVCFRDCLNLKTELLLLDCFVIKPEACRLAVGHRVLSGGRQAPLFILGTGVQVPSGLRMYFITRTGPFRAFQRRVGNTTFHINSAYVGLEWIARGKGKPDGLPTASRDRCARLAVRSEARCQGRASDGERRARRMDVNAAG
jgi:hypothetical protein